MDPKTSRNFVVGAVILVVLALVIALGEGGTSEVALGADRALAFIGTRFGLLAIAAILGFGFLIVFFAGKKRDK